MRPTERNALISLANQLPNQYWRMFIELMDTFTTDTTRTTEEVQAQLELSKRAADLATTKESRAMLLHGANVLKWVINERLTPPRT